MSEKVLESCRLLVSELNTEVFKTNQFRLMRKSGQLEAELKREGSRDDMAQFVFGWLEFHTCKLLDSLKKDDGQRLLANQNYRQ